MNKKYKVLVLGHNGMLGHVVVDHLQQVNMDVYTIDGQYPAIQSEILKFDGDYIVNCIGAIPQKTDDFSINTELPIWLEENVHCKVIHPGTDCEMDDDAYGLSKKAASDYIKEEGGRTKIIKTSIIGFEKDSHYSLLEWFLSQDSTVNGYTEAMWNGNTTLTWARFCVDMMRDWHRFETETILQSEPVSKFELLNIFKDVFNKDIDILPSYVGEDKCLTGPNSFSMGNIRDQLLELRDYFYEPEDES